MTFLQPLLMSLVLSQESEPWPFHVMKIFLFISLCSVELQLKVDFLMVTVSSRKVGEFATLPLLSPCLVIHSGQLVVCACLSIPPPPPQGLV